MFLVLDIPVNRLRWMGIVLIGAGIVMIVSSDKAISYSEEMTSVLWLGTARANGKMNQK